MGHYYRFKRGDPVTIVSGRYKSCTGLVDSAVFQRTVDYREEYGPGYHVVLDDGPVVTVRWDQVAKLWHLFRLCFASHCLRSFSAAGYWVSKLGQLFIYG